MSNTAENLPLIQEWLNVVAHEGVEFGKFVAKYSLMHVFNTAVGGLVGGAIGTWLIHKGIFKENHAVIGETMYVPSGVLGKDPETGEEFEYIDQVMRTKATNFTFQTAFHGEVAKTLSKKAKKASKLGTSEEPLIPTHLAKVIKAEDLPKLKKIFISQWKSHFGGRFDPDDSPSCHTIEGRQFIESTTIFVVPVHEKSEEGNPYKVLYIPLSQLKPGALPDAKHLRVKVGLDENGVSIYKHVANHPLNERLRTLKKVSEIVNSSPEVRQQWLEDFGVQIPTGRILDRGPAVLEQPLARAA